MKKIAIMTAGGDCPGLNSAIHSVVLTAHKNDIEVVGILDGYIGFCEKKYKILRKRDVYGIEAEGGTILGSSNKECPFRYPVKGKKGEYEDKVKSSIDALREIGVEAMIIIGGDGTLDSARVICEAGMPVIGIPKTIDNDMVASNPTIGFETAVENAVEAIAKLKTTAFSHQRIMVVEIMGRTSGYLTLYAGVASGSDLILLPEQDYDFDKVVDKVKSVMRGGKRYCIIAMAEAAKEKGKDEIVARIVEDSFEQKRYGGAAEKLARELEIATGYESRHMVLGHIQRGGTPCAKDIILASRLGSYAAELLIKGEKGYIVGSDAEKLKKMPFPKDREPRLLDYKNDDIIIAAKNMGISFGD